MDWGKRGRTGEKEGNALRIPPLLHNPRHILQPFIRLPRQFSTRTNDNPDRSLPPGERHLLLFLQRKHQERERERQGFARSGEGDADHVAPGEGDGETLKLDGGWGSDFLVLEVVEEGAREFHVLRPASQASISPRHGWKMGTGRERWKRRSTP